jgi:hypothetical protein
MFAMTSVQLKEIMNNLEASFEGVSDWCERHLEAAHGPEIAMTFAAMLRVYGRLSSLPSELTDEQRMSKKTQLSTKADELLMDLCTRFLVAYGNGKEKINPVAPMAMRTNMIYDPGKPNPQ